jgi:glyceraldehyde 3-phosphate dehydrogenase
MDKKTVAINGFGRIGRMIFKKILESGKLDVVLVNDLADKDTLEYLLKYDSVYGKSDVNLDGVNLTSESEPGLEADIVFESTGLFREYKDASKHKGRVVVISAPSKSEEVKHFVYGVNDDAFSGEGVISSGSCTTIAMANVLKPLNDKFGVERVFSTTTHSYTNSQSLVDSPLKKDPRRGRAAPLSIVPTTTGAAIAVEKVIPELSGKMQGVALRVPVETVSLVDMVIEFSKDVSVDEINNTVWDKTEEELVSRDLVGDERGAVVDTKFTQVDGNMAKVLAWYDNEAGYSHQVVKLLESIGDKL